MTLSGEFVALFQVVRSIRSRTERDSQKKPLLLEKPTFRETVVVVLEDWKGFGIPGTLGPTLIHPPATSPTSLLLKATALIIEMEGC